MAGDDGAALAALGAAGDAGEAAIGAATGDPAGTGDPAATGAVELASGAGASATAEPGDAPTGAGGLDAGQLARLREVLVAAHPEAVPELIAGADFDSLLGSVAGARAAFARVREETARAAAANVPRGGGTREIDPAVFAGLSPEGKIAQGLQGR